MNKKQTGFAIRLIVTILIVISITRMVKWDEIVAVLMNANITYILLSVAIVPLMVGVSVWKWHVLIKAQGIGVSYWKLYVLYLYGNFFNNFFPTSVGGDIVVWYELGASTNRPTETIASIFMNRFTGLVVVLLGSIIALVFNFAFFRDFYVAGAMGIAALASGLVVWFISDRKILEGSIRKFGGIRIVNKFLASLRKFQEALNVYRRSYGLVIYVMAISLIYYLMMAINIYLGAKAFNLKPSLLNVIIVLPFIQIVQMLPISLGGVGLKEWSYTVAFPYIGISSSAGLSVALFVRVKVLLIGILGGFLYPLTKHIWKDGTPGNAAVSLNKERIN